MQGGLVEFTPEQGDAAGAGEAQAGERRGGRRIEFTRDADLVTCQHGRSPRDIHATMLREVVTVHIVRRE